MSNPNFLTDEWGVPKPLADDLLKWAREQEVHVHASCSDEFLEREKDYQRARKLINRVKDLGYVRRAA